MQLIKLYFLIRGEVG